MFNEDKALLKTIINYLAFMLEFDNEYFRELTSQTIVLKRSFVSNQIKSREFIKSNIFKINL